MSLYTPQSPIPKVTMHTHHFSLLSQARKMSSIFTSFPLGYLPVDCVKEPSDYEEPAFVALLTSPHDGSLEHTYVIEITAADKENAAVT